MANRRAGNLVAKHAPRRCEVCGRTFVPYTGRALYCRSCRMKGSRWIKEQRKGSQTVKRAQTKAKEVLEDE